LKNVFLSDFGEHGGGRKFPKIYILQVFNEDTHAGVYEQVHYGKSVNVVIKQKLKKS